VRRLLNVPIDARSMHDVLALVDEAVAARRRLLIGVVNAAKLVNMQRDAALRQAVLTADIILADGMAVVWAARLLGRRLPERVAGIDLMTQMLRRGDQRGYRVYLLGATDKVLAATAARIRAEFPGVVLVGYRHGYFGAHEEAAIAEQICEARPDVLFAGMTSPKKEQFLARWSALMQVPVCHGVGGAFDVLAGKTRRAPQLWQRLGLEWLYRVVQEPRRMWRRYLVTNTLFCLMVAAEIGGRSRVTART
jgi:N-acetylglucosaminyldiphosphoundecaprenol N-acetyl-beta-D-mannosaminyltransferase